jgi:RNA polymerase sigma factor for flagellar operon FliA
MGTTAKSAIQKYQKASGKKPEPKPEKPELKAKATAPAAETKSAKNTSKNPKDKEIEIKASAHVESAIEKKQESGEKVSAEIELQKEIEKELVLDVAHTNKLVKGDFSPVNTNREKLIREYAGLIKFIAQKIAARLPSNIELDDLISSGVIGLMDAIDKYDSGRDNKFKTYAEFRIRGAILDELRSQDWVPRSVREKAKILERAYAKIEQSKGRQATDDEVCIELGMNTEQYHEMLNEVRSVSLLSYDDLSNLSNADKRSMHGAGENNSKVLTPFSEVSGAHMKKLVAEAIEDLPEKQRLVLSLYYYEDLNLKEIGRVLDVTESRVSQLHSQAILKLKARLRTNWDDFVQMMA